LTANGAAPIGAPRQGGRTMSGADEPWERAPNIEGNSEKGSSPIALKKTIDIQE